MKRVVADTEINTLKQVLVLVQAFQANEADRLIRRNINTTFINALVDQFQGLPQALIWLKTSLGIRTAGKMVDDFGYTGSLLQRLADLVKDAYHWVRSIKVRGRLIGVAIDFLSKFNATAMSYLDLLSDTFLLALLILSTDMLDTKHITNHSDKFAFQTVLLLLISMLVPMLISGCTTAYKRPLAPFGYRIWRQSSQVNGHTLNMVRGLVVLLYPIVPALIVCSKKSAENEKRDILELCCRLTKAGKYDVAGLLETVAKLDEYLEELKAAHLTFKRNELSLEIVIQLSVHTTMVLLSRTLIPLESGLQSIFQKAKAQDSTWEVMLLWVSVIWSFKTTALTSVKIKEEAKVFFPLKAKILLGLRALLVYLVRVGCLVAYFAPFLGLLDCLNHYHMEKITLADTSDFEFSFRSTLDFYQNSSSVFHYWNNETEQPEKLGLRSVFRTNFNDQSQPIDSSLYTSITLGVAYGIFWFGFLIFGLFLFGLKTAVSDDFRKSDTFSRLQHVLWAINTPETFKDWDTGNGDRKDLIAKWWAKYREVTIMQCIHLTSNMILLVPLINTGNFLS